MGRDTELVVARGMVAGIRCEAESWERHFHEERKRLQEVQTLLDERTREVDMLRADLDRAEATAKRSKLLDFATPNIDVALREVKRALVWTLEEQREAAIVAVREAIKLDMLSVYEGLLKVFEQLKVEMPAEFAKLGLLG